MAVCAAGRTFAWVQINCGCVLVVPVAVEAVNLSFMWSIPGRSQWPHGLRRGSVAVLFLGLWQSCRGLGCLSFMSVVCCQVEISTSVRSLDRRFSAECVVSGCDRKASIMRRPWTIRGCCTMGEKLRVPLCYLDVYRKSVPSTQLVYTDNDAPVRKNIMIQRIISYLFCYHFLKLFVGVLEIQGPYSAVPGCQFALC